MPLTSGFEKNDIKRITEFVEAPNAAAAIVKVLSEISDNVESLSADVGAVPEADGKYEVSINYVTGKPVGTETTDPLGD